MKNRLVLATLAAAGGLILPLLSPVVAQAGEPPAGAVAYRRQPSVCVNDGTGISIGGSVFMKEFGKRRVRQMRVEWLLYDSYQSPGHHVAVRRKTYQTGKFPDDARNYTWDGRAAGGNFQRWNNLPITDDGYTLIAKMTWARPSRRDWNYKLPVARCT